MTELSPLWQQAVDEGRVSLERALIEAPRFSEERNTCDLCGKLIVPHIESVYGGVSTPRHYDCHRAKHGPNAIERYHQATKDLKESQARVGEAIAKLREGLGKLQGAVDKHEGHRSQMERDFDRQRFDDGPQSGPVKR